MRRTTCHWAFVALVVAISLAGCSSGAKTPAGQSSAAASSSASSQTTACAKGSLQLVGSTAFLPIAQDGADAYMQRCPGVTITVSGGDSAYGLTKVRDAVAAGSASAGSTIAMYDGSPSATAASGLSPYPMGVLIYSAVAHTGLIPGANVTTGELRKIFVSPGEKGKVAVGRRGGSGSRQAFVQSVLGVNPGPPTKGNCPPPTGGSFTFTSCTEDSTTDLLNFIDGTPDAIGYAELYRPISTYPQAAVIDINGAAPTPHDVRNGTYKFWTVEHLYAPAQATALAKDFLDFLPRFLGTDPPNDFIPCSDTLKSLGASC
jgi:phosphate transport system substrate-binding protein